MTSREVSSNQDGIHQHLHAVVKKHLNHEWRKPINDFSIEAFATIEAWLSRQSGPFILDSGCGTGESSVNLALMFPEAKVVGFDRSVVRLDKLKRKMTLPNNCLVVRADANDLWRQLLQAKIHPTRHYLFYPNPYPKAAQLNQRWHGSPVFPYLVALGGTIELRSNWRIYLEEFSEAISITSGVRPNLSLHDPKNAISAFESKYHSSGQQLWRLTIEP